MALVQCKECERDVSTYAEKCPHCGYPMKATTQKAERKDPFEDDYGFDNNPFQSTAPPGPRPRPTRQDPSADSKAVTGLILAIVAFFLPIPFLDMAMSIGAIVLGNQAKQSKNLRYIGTATASVVLGIISLIFNIIVWSNVYL